MGLTAHALHSDLKSIAALDPRIKQALDLTGLPQARHHPRGYKTLLHTIVGQQVSVAAAASVWKKLEAFLGADLLPETLLAADFDSLRACGLSRQKQGYARSLCELVVERQIDLDNLPTEDEEAIAELIKIKGIGRWSAEIYLLFAEGRPDIWPAGDLGIQAGLQQILNLDERPLEKATRLLSAPWRPYRGAMAIFTWHCYNNPALK